MSKEAEVLLAEVLSSFEGYGFSIPPKLFKEITEAMKAYADKANKKLIAKIELLEACREYDASGENRPDGYIVPNHYTGQRIDEMNKPLNK